MGTDIHMACEVRRNGKWGLMTDKVFRNTWYDPTSDFDWCKEELTNIPYDSRCYNLFAILADVRNGSGFAGVKIGEYFNPISEPKGYPDDLCEELQEDAPYRNDIPMLSYQHSASWLTLRELIEYDWEQLHRNYGCVSEKTYKDDIMQNKHPQCWSGSVDGRNIVHLSEEDMVDLINGKYSRDDTKQYYTYCYFIPETYKETSGGFYDNVISVLKTLVPKGGTYDDVRLVFDFDS